MSYEKSLEDHITFMESHIDELKKEHDQEIRKLEDKMLFYNKSFSGYLIAFHRIWEIILADRTEYDSDHRDSKEKMFSKIEAIVQKHRELMRAKAGFTTSAVYTLDYEQRREIEMIMDDLVIEKKDDGSEWAKGTLERVPLSREELETMNENIDHYRSGIDFQIKKSTGYKSS